MRLSNSGKMPNKPSQVDVFFVPPTAPLQTRACLGRQL